MPLSRRAVLGAGAASAVALLAGCTGDWGINGTKVLFIGNSFTDFNGGLDGMLKQLAPRTEAARISPGGSNLQQHSVSDEHASSLKTGGWQYVVLQDQSQFPVMEPEQFMAGASAMVAKIRTTKATRMFLATWGRPDSPGVTSKSLDAAYRSMGDRLLVSVIPAHGGLSADVAQHLQKMAAKVTGH